MPAIEIKKKVLILAFGGFETLEFSAFVDVLGWARAEGALDIEFETAGFSKEVKSTYGVTIRVDRLLEDVDPDEYNALAIPGGFEEYGFYEDAYRNEAAELIRAFFEAGKPIASVCVGALALGNSGVLKGRKATTYALSGGHRQKQLADFGASVLPNEQIVIDGELITSCGPSTAVMVAFQLLAKLTDLESTKKVVILMGFDPDTLEG